MLITVHTDQRARPPPKPLLLCKRDLKTLQATNQGHLAGQECPGSGYRCVGWVRNGTVVLANWVN